MATTRPSSSRAALTRWCEQPGAGVWWGVHVTLELQPAAAHRVARKERVVPGAYLSEPSYDIILATSTSQLLPGLLDPSFPSRLMADPRLVDIWQPPLTVLILVTVRGPWMRQNTCSSPSNVSRPHSHQIRDPNQSSHGQNASLFTPGLGGFAPTRPGPAGTRLDWLLGAPTVRVWLGRAWGGLEPSHDGVEEPTRATFDCRFLLVRTCPRVAFP